MFDITDVYYLWNVKKLYRSKIPLSWFKDSVILLRDNKTAKQKMKEMIEFCNECGWVLSCTTEYEGGIVAFVWKSLYDVLQNIDTTDIDGWGARQLEDSARTNRVILDEFNVCQMEGLNNGKIKLGLGFLLSDVLVSHFTLFLSTSHYLEAEAPIHVDEEIDGKSVGSDKNTSYESESDKEKMIKKIMMQQIRILMWMLIWLKKIIIKAWEVVKILVKKLSQIKKEAMIVKTNRMRTTQKRIN